MCLTASTWGGRARASRTFPRMLPQNSTEKKVSRMVMILDESAEKIHEWFGRGPFADVKEIVALDWSA